VPHSKEAWNHSRTINENRDMGRDSSTRLKGCNLAERWRGNQFLLYGVEVLDIFNSSTYGWQTKGSKFLTSVTIFYSVK
jgi:hypothetical protein